MRKRNIGYYLLILPLMIFVGLFIIYPYVNIVIRAFHDNYTYELTFDNIKRVFTERAFKGAIFNSLWFSLATTLVSSIFGSIVGWISMKMTDKGRNVLMALFSVPMTLSGLVVAFSFIVMFGRNGIYNIIANKLFLPNIDIYTWGGLILAYSFFNIPLFSLTMINGFKNLDISLVEAAKNLGANTIQTWIYVIIPVLIPSFLAAFSIVFAGMMGAFGTVLAITGMSKMLLSLQIYSHVTESTYNIPQADAFALVLGAIVAIVLILINFVERKVRVKTR